MFHPNKEVQLILNKSKFNFDTHTFSMFKQKKSTRARYKKRDKILFMFFYGYIFTDPQIGALS